MGNSVNDDLTWMSGFGHTLFGGSRFVRWTLTPFVLVFAIFMPLCIDDWTLTSAVVMGGLELMCLSILAGFWLPARFGYWAFRVLTGLVFTVYLAYLIEEFFFTDKPFSLSSRSGSASPLNALLGFLLIGLPSLLFTLFGRFSFRADPSDEQLAHVRRDHEALLLQPDWEFYGRHLERPIPPALRELFADKDLITGVEFVYADDLGISSFEPLNERGLLDTRDQVGSDVVAFATSDCGDPIYLRPGPTEPNKVYMTSHDDNETTVVAQSVESFLKQLRSCTRAS